jgi:predicted transcriptional regulator
MYDVFKTIVERGALMMEIKKLPDAELDIMKVVWQLEPPVISGMILEGLARETDREWKLQTLHTLLNRLVERGFLSFEKKRKDKCFFPLIGQDEYMQFETENFLKQYHGGSWIKLVNAAYQGESLNDDDIDELVQWANGKGRAQP